MNCCLFDVQNVLSGGFEMGNIWYNEPKTLDVAFDVIGDIVLSAASQQYGGFTVPQVDKILEPYAEKTFKRQYDRYTSLGLSPEKAEEEALKDVRKDMLQGFQGWEYKFNTVASSRGDYPFITITGGLGTSRFAKMANICMLEVRKGGQGKKECKKPVLFPKIVFLYDENLHGPGKELEDVFEAGLECSAKTMYPDWLSLTGEGYVASIYKKYGECEELLPDEETSREIYLWTGKYLKSRGFEQYEISNYAREGKQSAHNLRYWERKDYLGLGLGGASMIRNMRMSNTRDWDKYMAYCRDPGKIREEVEVLEESGQMEEFMFLGLRKTRGISKKEFRRTFGKDIDLVYEKTLEKYLKNGMLQESGDRIFLSEEGILLSNQVFADFLFDG